MKRTILFGFQTAPKSEQNCSDFGRCLRSKPFRTKVERPKSELVRILAFHCNMYQKNVSHIYKWSMLLESPVFRHLLCIYQRQLGEFEPWFPGTCLQTCKLVVYRNEWMMWRERPRWALPVNEQGLWPAVNHVLLHLGNVVRHVVNHVHVLVEDDKQNLITTVIK